MQRTQVYLPNEELEAFRKAAARAGRSVADLVREAIRMTVPKPVRFGIGRATGRRATPILSGARHRARRTLMRQGEAAFVDSGAWIDATRFAIMKRARIRRAFAFDHPFSVVGARRVA